MILITGGLGFIGSHVTRALLDLGECCVATRHHGADVPAFLRTELGTRLLVEPLELEDEGSLSRIGEQHAITGVVHLADTAIHRLWKPPGDDSPLRLDGLFDGLTRVLRAASDWGASRVTIASTIGVYGGIEPGLWNEEQALRPTSSHAVPTVKQCSELLAAYLGSRLGLEVISVRLSAIWGPGGRPASGFFALPSLVHAAIRPSPEAAARVPDPLYARDGCDLCYVKDCGRAIALLQTAGRLDHGTYNVGSGRVTTNAEVVEAIRVAAPSADFVLADRRNPSSMPIDPYLDLARIRAQVEYEPAFDVRRGIADYVAWLRSGHVR